MGRCAEVLAEPHLLVAGDSDYSPLVQRLREFCKYVVVVGTEASASPRLVSVCSEYKCWGTLVAAVERSAQPAGRASFDIQDGERLQVQASTTGMAMLRPGVWLKHKMLHLDPLFDGRKYGGRSFKEFLGRRMHAVTVQAGGGPGNLRVRLIMPEHPDTKTQRLVPRQMFSMGTYDFDDLVDKDAVTCMRIRGPLA
nr:NYN domain-containing protein [Amycolatopsis umgeniensis]